jgi:hypothetical protein
LSSSRALPGDDAPVERRTALYRLVPTSQCEVRDGQWAFRSSAFDNSSLPGFTDEMSVILGDTLAALDRDPLDLHERFYPSDPANWGVARLEAGCVVDSGPQEVRRSPTVDERAHGDVVGAKGGGQRKRLKKCASWVFPPSRPADSG